MTLVGVCCCRFLWIVLPPKNYTYNIHTKKVDKFIKFCVWTTLPLRWQRTFHTKTSSWQTMTNLSDEGRMSRERISAARWLGHFIQQSESSFPFLVSTVNGQWQKPPRLKLDSPNLKSIHLGCWYDDPIFIKRRLYHLCQFASVASPNSSGQSAGNLSKTCIF